MEEQVLDPTTKRWLIKGVVVWSRISGDGTPSSYYVETEDGGTVWRGARFMKARRSYVSNKLQKRVGFLLAGQERQSTN